MTALVKIQRKGQMTLPSRFRLAVGVSEGDMIEVSVQRGKIVLTPKAVVDRAQIASAHDEHTPAGRRAINRGIAQSEKEYKQGRSFGPFNTHEEFLASLHKESARLSGTKRKRPAR
jgi:AbrB family looped-hinge helix DNA binding protein